MNCSRVYEACRQLARVETVSDFRQSGHALDQTVTVAEQRDEQSGDEPLLADDHAADL